MKLKWLYFLGIYLLSIGLISNSFDEVVFIEDSLSYEVQESENVGPQGSELGVNFSDKARAGRANGSFFQRQKADRADKFEDVSLVFLSCKLTRSYSETDIDKYYLQLIGRSIQVNAP